MSLYILVPVALFWIWCGYMNWRIVTQELKYLQIYNFIQLLGLLFLGILGLILNYAASTNDEKTKFDFINLTICKRWLSKKEKIALVKTEMTK
jgi:hypothetical protein